MKALICAAVLAAAVVSVQAQEKLGNGVTLQESTPIASLVNHPDQFLGKTVRVDGVGTAVCEMMGCWVAIAESDAKDAKTVRVKVEDGVIKIPVTAKGKQISAEGVFEEAKPETHEKDAAEHAKHMAEAKPDPTKAAAQHAGEHNHEAPKGKTYQIKGTGLVIR